VTVSAQNGPVGWDADDELLELDDGCAARNAIEERARPSVPQHGLARAQKACSARNP